MLGVRASLQMRVDALIESGNEYFRIFTHQLHVKPSYANRFGQEIWREPRGRFAGYHWPQYSIHRGALQMLLAAAVRERFAENEAA
jgi:hypothetical protein